MLDDGGGGDLKAGLSRFCVSTVFDIACAFDGGVEGIWMSSEDPTESKSDSALAMDAP